MVTDNSEIKRVCARCQKALPAIDFYKGQGWCKACFRPYLRQYQADRSEQRGAALGKWARENPYWLFVYAVWWDRRRLATDERWARRRGRRPIAEARAAQHREATERHLKRQEEYWTARRDSDPIQAIVFASLVCEAFRVEEGKRLQRSVRAAYVQTPEHQRHLRHKTYLAHREAQIGRARAWAKAHPEKRAEMAKRRGGSGHSFAKRDYIYQRDGGRCQICGVGVKKDEMTMDHIVPVSLGGRHERENLQLAHFSCNSSRGAGRIPAQTRMPLWYDVGSPDSIISRKGGFYAKQG